MILLIDNYDSFTFNVARYLQRLQQEVCVLRNDSGQLASVAEASAAIVISPGPKAPAQAGLCLEIVRDFHPRKPILGICLGHQVICEAFGGRIVRAQRPVHGRELPITNLAGSLFKNIPDRATFARYHSLVAEAVSLPQCLTVTASSETGEIMAVEHKEYPCFGVQFHPESVLSVYGFQLLSSFLQIARLVVPEVLPQSDLRRMESASVNSPIEVQPHTQALSSVGAYVRISADDDSTPPAVLPTHFRSPKNNATE